MVIKENRKLDGFGKHLTQIVTSRKISYRLMHCAMHIQNLTKVNKKNKTVLLKKNVKMINRTSNTTLFYHVCSEIKAF